MDDMQNWQKTLGQTAEQLDKYRDRGYVHDGWLEKTAAAIVGKLPGFMDHIHRAAKKAVDEYSWHLDELARDLPDAQGQLSDDEASNNAVIAPLEDHLATLNRVAEDLGHRLREKKETLEPHYRKVAATLRQIGRKTEDILTMLVDEEIGLLQESVDSKKGFIIKDQILTLNWHGSAAYQTTTFEIKGKAKAWDTLIEDTVSGTIDRHRVQGADLPPKPETPKNFPAQCEACGAGFDKPVVRGTTERVCAYCGHRHPL